MNGFRALPSVDRLLQLPEVRDAPLPRQVLVAAARATLETERERVGRGVTPADPSELAARTLDLANRRLAPSLRGVVNATGVVLHTNLGRAPVSEEAARAMADAASHYSNLEFDLGSGERGSRHDHLRDLLRDVTGADDGIAVNNNAGAVLLALSALASGREVIVSRGQAVEIGGGFRIPDVMRQSGCRLVEVGTTNRTYASDYRQAIGDATALLLHVHPSNFRVEGFVNEVGIGEMVEVARSAGIGVLDDIGSGALLDTREFGLAGEPRVQDSVRDGASIVCFSGDKLLGGPQAGLIVGARDAIARVRAHPLARALRIDKASLAGLETTLRHYVRGEATAKIPIWRAVATPLDELERRAARLVAAIDSPRLRTVSTRAAVGGGSLPQETVPSFALKITPRPGLDIALLARRLRAGDPPVVGRIEDNALILDLRTVLPGEDATLLATVRAALNAES